jgi:hypothetical protein
MAIESSNRRRFGWQPIEESISPSIGLRPENPSVSMVSPAISAP